MLNRGKTIVDAHILHLRMSLAYELNKQLD